MQVRGPVDETKVLSIAAAVRLDLERLKADMEDPAIWAAIDRNLELARTLRVDGTPAFVIGEHILRGAVDLNTMVRFIREAREKR
jgi:protein-disulfide isomerase